MENLNAHSLQEIKKETENFCKMKSMKEIKGVDIFNSKPKLKKLYTMASLFNYEKHSGPVYSIKHSPFQRNLFLTASSDGSVRLYDSLQVIYQFSSLWLSSYFL
jgi:WD40 repeat protein